MSKRCCVIGRSKTCGSSASPTAGASWAWVTWAPTAWGYRSASCSSTPQRPASRRKGCCRCISTPGPTTSNTWDPLYLGLRQTRPPTEELYSFVDEFVEAVQEVFPKCCIHFEDWTGVDAVRLLQRYRDKYCVYNDDIQGTAGITIAGMINASKLKGVELKDEKYLFLGAGSSGIGLANLLCSALAAQGMSRKD